MDYRNISNKYIYFFVLVLIGVLYFFLEWNTTPTLNDDLIYRFQFRSDGSTEPLPINNISDLLHSLIVHYNTWNGRLANILAPILLLLPHTVLSVINTILFILLLHLSMKIIHAEGVNKLIFVSIESCFIFLVMRGFKTAMLWNMGSFNYLWVIVANLAIFCYIRSVKDKDISWRACLLSPLALFAGWGHEGLSLPLCVGIAAYIVQYRRTIKHSALLPYFLFYFLGTLLCVCAPGIWKRADSGISFYMRMVNGAVAMALVVRILWLLLPTIVIGLWNKAISFEMFKSKAYIILTLLAAYGIVFLNGTPLDRVAFNADFLSLLCMLNLWMYVFKKVYLHIFAIVFSSVALIVYVPALSLSIVQKKDFLWEEKQIKQPDTYLIETQTFVPKNILESAIYDRYVIPFIDYGFYTPYMGFNSQELNMRYVAKLYGKEKLLFLPKDIVETIKKDSTAFSDFQVDKSGKLIVKRLLPGQQVHDIVFHLNKEIPNLHFWQKWVAYKGMDYVLTKINWNVVSINNHRYVILTTPLSNIKRRTKSIELI